LGIGTFRQATETFLVLKTNFAGLGNYEDASWAYVKEQQMQKASHFPTTVGKRLMRRVARRAGLQVPQNWWSFSPRALRYRAFSAGLHTRLFLGVLPPGAKSRLKKERDKWRWARSWVFELLTGYGERPVWPLVWGFVTIMVFACIYSLAGSVTRTPDGESTHDFVTALTASVATFATIGFNDIQPIGWGARLLSAIEAMLGIGTFALFVYTLGNRMSRS
jgi:hypothetical protein